MLSKEEKKAIEDLKNAVNEPLEVFENVVDTFKLINLDQCRIVLNLIEKQQKEIEEKNIAINKMSKDISSQLEEIDEKSTIIMAGAERVKQLEKEIEELKLDLEEMTKTYNHMKENWIHKLALNSYIRKDKIREIIENSSYPDFAIQKLLELLEEK